MSTAFRLNGRRIEVDAPQDTTLLELLRDRLGLTGTKEGCSIGECGACSVILDGRLVNSCLVLAAQLDGSQVVTIEGLTASDGDTSDLQRAFIQHGALQCGFCTPGMILAAEALLANNPSPTRLEIQSALAGNLCRCTGYHQIFEAIEATAQRRRETGASSPIKNVYPRDPLP